MSAPSEHHPKPPPSPQPPPAHEVTDGSNIPASDSEPDDADNSVEPAPFPPGKSDASTTSLLIDPSYRSSRISNAHTDQHLYDVALHSISRPHVVITAAPSSGDGEGKGKEVATITFHPFARHITFFANGRECRIEHKGVFKSGYTYVSPALGGKVEWKGGADAVMVNEKGEAVARMESHRMQAWRKRRVEVISMDEKVVMEVLVSAVAIMELRRRRSRNSAGGAGGGAP